MIPSARAPKERCVGSFYKCTKKPYNEMEELKRRVLYWCGQYDSAVRCDVK